MMCCLTAICQLLLLIEILAQLIIGEKKKYTKMLNVGAIIFARFICATILHLSLLEEVNGAL